VCVVCVCVCDFCDVRVCLFCEDVFVVCVCVCVMFLGMIVCAVCEIVRVWYMCTLCSFMCVYGVSVCWEGVVCVFSGLYLCGLYVCALFGLRVCVCLVFV